MLETQNTKLHAQVGALHQWALDGASSGRVRWPAHAWSQPLSRPNRCGCLVPCAESSVNTMSVLTSIAKHLACVCAPLHQMNYIPAQRPQVLRTNHAPEATAYLVIGSDQLHGGGSSKREYQTSAQTTLSPSFLWQLSLVPPPPPSHRHRRRRRRRRRRCCCCCCCCCRPHFTTHKCGTYLLRLTAPVVVGLRPTASRSGSYALTDETSVNNKPSGAR
jgi:hypothetical protein